MSIGNKCLGEKSSCEEGEKLLEVGISVILNSTVKKDGII